MATPLHRFENRRFFRLGAQFTLWMGLLLGSTVAMAGVSPEVSISSADPSADEAGADPATFTITRSVNSTSALLVNISIAGTAVRNIDYSLPGIFSGAPLAINIPANETSAQFTLTPLADNIVEMQEDVLVTVEPGTGYNVAVANSQTLTIEDDVPEVNLTLIDGAMAEAGRDPGSFRVTRTDAGNTGLPITVNIDITGTATHNVDFSTPGVFGGAPLAVQIPASQLEATFNLVPSLDNLVEGEETVQIVLQPNASVYTVGADTTADFTLADDVPEVNLTLIDGAMAEAGRDPGSFRVTRTDAGNTGLPITVNIEITGTAIHNVDFSTPDVFGGAPLAVQIPANQLEATFNLVPLLDNLVEGEETVQIVLQPSASVYTVGANTTADFTLADDVPEVNLSVVDSAMSESGLDTGSFRVTRSNAGNIAVPISINIDITGTATRNVDYTTQGVFGGAPLAVQIPANQLEATLILTPVADAPDDEGDETIEVVLQSGPNYTTGPNTTASLVLADLLDFLFADSFEVPLPQQNKACQFQQLAADDSGRYFDQGATVLDLATDLVWAKCGLAAGFDWNTGLCTASETGYSQAEAMARFNAGDVGDNGGFSDWRAPSALELATLPAGCTPAAVR